MPQDVVLTSDDHVDLSRFFPSKSLCSCLVFHQLQPFWHAFLLCLRFTKYSSSLYKSSFRQTGSDQVIPSHTCLETNRCFCNSTHRSCTEQALIAQSLKSCRGDFTSPSALDSCAFQVLVKCSTLKFKHAETSQESNWIKSLMPARPAWVKNGQTLNKSIRCLSEQEGCP